MGIRNRSGLIVSAFVLICPSVLSLATSLPARAEAIGLRAHGAPIRRNSTGTSGRPVYFAADDGVHGRELWRSDGTSAGTTIVKDIFPGPDPSYPSELIDVAGTVFFIADDGTHGSELWKSDGSTAGTEIVKDIRPGSSEGFPYPRSLALTDVGATLYFAANDGTHGSELWKSDGTDVGTVMVKDISPGSSGSPLGFAAGIGPTLYFTAISVDGAHGWELWKSDGSGDGTVMVKDLASSEVREFTVVGGTLYFNATESAHGQELWKSDGTAASTMMVKDIMPGSGSSDPRSLTRVEGTLFFRAFDVTHGEELWKSDGTAHGTVMVKDIRSGSRWSNPVELTNVGGVLYFSALDDTDLGLFKSDGTAAGTAIVKYVYMPLHELTEFKGILYFAGEACGHGHQLWKSDGSSRGTVVVKVVSHSGNCASGLKKLTASGGTLFFTGDDDFHGRELWKSDGTKAGTEMVKNIWPGSMGSDPADVVFVQA